MTNIVIAAAAATLLTVTAATANDLAILGGVEYTTEAEVLEVTIGAEYAVNNFIFTPLLTINDSDGDVEFTGADLIVGYTVSSVVAVYATVEADSDWNRTETTLGASFRF